ncbi:hypothetical protein SK128_003672 [Halocaridina rubra]|uniref:Uncharacterized protein n=1 Tax=Halocaridina rubra TaxID=373956 RepID=A0AAN8XD59_HALRR
MTPRDFAEKRTSPGKGYLALTPILAVLFGVLASLFLMVLVIVIIIKSRRLHPRKSELKGTSDERESPGIIHLCEAPNGNDQIQDIISVHNGDHPRVTYGDDDLRSSKVQRTPVVSPSRSHVTVDPKRADAERIRKPRLTINTSECSWKATNNPRSLKRMRSLEAEDVTSPYLLDAPVFQEEWKIKETLLATSPWLYEEPHRSESLGAPEFVEGLAPWPPLVTKKAEKVRIVCPLDSKVRIELKF